MKDFKPHTINIDIKTNFEKETYSLYSEVHIAGYGKDETRTIYKGRVEYKEFDYVKYYLEMLRDSYKKDFQGIITISIYNRIICSIDKLIETITPKLFMEMVNLEKNIYQSNKNVAIGYLYNFDKRTLNSLQRQTTKEINNLINNFKGELLCNAN